MNELLDLNRQICDLRARIDHDLLTDRKEISKELVAVSGKLTQYLSALEKPQKNDKGLYEVKCREGEEVKFVVANSRSEAIVKFLDNTIEDYHNNIKVYKLVDIENIIDLNLP